MYTLAELLEFRQFVLANLLPSPRRASILHVLSYMAEVLTEARKEMATASMNGQIQRLTPPSRATMVQTAVDDTQALLDGMTVLPSTPSRRVIDFGTWALPQIPPGPRRTQLQTLLTQTGILEGVERRQFIAASVNGQQQRATPPTRPVLVQTAIDDALAMVAAFNQLPSGGVD